MQSLVAAKFVVHSPKKKVNKIPSLTVNKYLTLLKLIAYLSSQVPGEKRLQCKFFLMNTKIWF
jgi:hypothetical protein